MIDLTLGSINSLNSSTNSILCIMIYIRLSIMRRVEWLLAVRNVCMRECIHKRDIATLLSTYNEWCRVLLGIYTNKFYDTL